jgi:hypothetical protein
MARIGFNQNLYAKSVICATSASLRCIMRASSYENRANAYMKTEELGLAIHDLTTAISLQIGGMVLLSNINQFRALYPEYQTVADETIARKLNQTFYPDIKFEVFSEGFLHGRAMGSTVIPDLYLKRSDAYLKTGNWHSLDRLPARRKWIPPLCRCGRPLA